MKLLDSHEDGYGQGSTTKASSAARQAAAAKTAKRDLILQLHQSQPTEWDNHLERKESQIGSTQLEPNAAGQAQLGAAGRESRAMPPT